MNLDQYKAKKRELKQKLADLNELAALEKLTHSKEAARLLFKERQKLRKAERAKVKDES